MRGKLFALIALVGMGTAAYFVVPLTPIPTYVKDVTHRIGLLFGENPDAPDETDETVAFPARLQAKLDKLAVTPGAQVALQIMTDSGAVALWVRDGDRFRPLEIFPFCGDAVRNDDLGTYRGDYTISTGDIILDNDGHSSVMLNRKSGRDNPEKTPEKKPDMAPETVNPPPSDLALDGDCAPKHGIPLESDDLRDIMLMVNAALNGGQASVPVAIYPSAGDQPTPGFSSTLKNTDAEN